MIGSGLKKLAREHGMTVAGGVGYGVLGGYAATLSEGSGYKRICFTTTFQDLALRTQLMDMVNQGDIRKTYRIQDVSVWNTGIDVVFGDTVGTMEKIRGFLAWFLPLLDQFGASRGDICTECGCQMTNVTWVQLDGICVPLHDICAHKVQRKVQEENTARVENDTGSYLTGAVGALTGTVVGAVLWAIVLNLGYVASLVGLVIGWLAEKGYRLLRGREGRGKLVILILAVIFGVVLGTLGADVVTLVGMVQGGELPGMGLGDIPSLMLFVFLTDAAYRGATIGNIVLGLLFAALGVFYMLKKTAKEVSGVKFRYLK